MFRRRGRRRLGNRQPSPLAGELRVYRRRHSGEEPVTAAKQRSGLPHRSEKDKHECQDQQNIEARGREETCHNVALKDSFEVSRVCGAFLRSLTCGHTASSLPALRGCPPSWQPVMHLGKYAANSVATGKQVVEKS
jgi:hypothetical protein